MAETTTTTGTAPAAGGEGQTPQQTNQQPTTPTAEQRTAFQKPASYFHHYKDLSPEETREVGRRLWAEINEVNLRENILPTRERADVILRKRADHSIGQVSLLQL